MRDTDSRVHTTILSVRFEVDFGTSQKAASIMKRQASTNFALLCTALLAVSIGMSCVGQTANRLNDAIDRAVKHALYDHEEANLLQVEISSSGGIVYLSGEVETYQHKEQAERLAKRVDGVTAVVNKIRVEP